MSTSVKLSNNDLQSLVKNRTISLNRPSEGVRWGRERTVPTSYSSFSFFMCADKDNNIDKLPPGSRGITKKRVAEDDTVQETQSYCFDFILSLSDETGPH
jgi:hypothetical protein